jgi:hypothetical protein
MQQSSMHIGNTWPHALMRHAFMQLQIAMRERDRHATANRQRPLQLGRTKFEDKNGNF